MNPNPDTKGIVRKWSPEDARCDIYNACPGVTTEQIDMVLGALQRTLASRARTKIVGFGVYEWKRWRNRIPTGKFVDSWRMAFKPSRYAPKYQGAK